MQGGCLVVGVTGGIGSGKTIFTHELGQMNTHVIDVDKVAKKIVNRNINVQTAIRRTFGYGIFDQSGKLRRRELGRIVFANTEKLDSLNQIIHRPLIKRLKADILAQKNKGNDLPIIVDMAILFEAGFEADCDLIVMVTAPLEKRVDWLIKDRGWSIVEIFSRIHAQQKIERYRENADVIIENSGTLTALREKARSFFEKYIKNN
jgi:dephospho-CoA kinase